MATPVVPLGVPVVGATAPAADCRCGRVLGATHAGLGLGRVNTATVGSQVARILTNGGGGTASRLLGRGTSASQAPRLATVAGAPAPTRGDSSPAAAAPAAPTRGACRGSLWEAERSTSSRSVQRADTSTSGTDTTVAKRQRPETR